VCREVARERSAQEDLGGKLDAARAEAAQKGEQVAQLKALFTQLQGAREQLNGKLQASYADLARLEERERELLDQVRGLERRLDDRHGASCWTVSTASNG
jgi:chromosome segregation ATPase